MEDEVAGEDVNWFRAVKLCDTIYFDNWRYLRSLTVLTSGRRRIFCSKVLIFLW